jgi:hypothetical protein
MTQSVFATLNRLSCVVVATLVGTSCATRTPDEDLDRVPAAGQTGEEGSFDVASSDEVPAGMGRSTVTLGRLGTRDMRKPISQQYVEGPDGDLAEAVIVYSPVYSDGTTITLRLPYDGNPSIVEMGTDAAGSYGLMLTEPAQDPMGSVSGRFEVMPTDGAKVEIRMFDLELSGGPLSTSPTDALGDGMIVGEVERSCLILRPQDTGLVDSAGRAPLSHQTDDKWESDFCRKYR